MRLKEPNRVVGGGVKRPPKSLTLGNGVNVIVVTILSPGLMVVFNASLDTLTLL